jgi:predicted transcriptional regulator
VLPKLRALKTVRESQFLTQQELAEKAGISRVTVNRLEQQEMDARFSTVKKLARALKVPPSELVGAEA